MSVEPPLTASFLLALNILRLLPQTRTFNVLKLPGCEGALRVIGTTVEFAALARFFDYNFSAVFRTDLIGFFGKRLREFAFRKGRTG